MFKLMKTRHHVLRYPGRPLISCVTKVLAADARVC